MKKLLNLALQNKHVDQRITCINGADSSDIYLKGVISDDYGISATDLRNAFSQAGGADVRLHINSPGGDVFEGREMQAVIAGYPGKVTAIIEGMAASAATFVTLSCAEVQMVKGSRYMIHNGATFAFGDKNALRATFELLEGFDAELASEYAGKAKGTNEQMTAWMDAETWFTADEALEAGFIDKINPNSQAVANVWDLSAYSKAPDLSYSSGAKGEDLPPPVTDEHRDRQKQRLIFINRLNHQ